MEVNIESVFSSYEQFNKRNIVIITEDICQNNNFYIGSLKPVEKDIVDYLRINKSTTKNELSDITGLKLDSLDILIDNLHKMRLIRFGGGDSVFSI